MSRLNSFILRFFRGSETRSRPEQRVTAQRYAWGVPGDDLGELMQFYENNPWVYGAVSRMAEDAAGAGLTVFEGDRPLASHPLMDLLGPYGSPNDNQDSFEFWETRFSDMLICGRVYWYWWSDGWLLPTEVHILDPRYVLPVPGTVAGVDYYRYVVGGREFKLPAVNVTHFRAYAPRNRLVGQGAMRPGYLSAAGDNAMARWNSLFFGEHMAIPGGIFVVDENTPPDEMDRIEAELSAKHGQQRRTMVVRGRPGSSNYHATGTSLRDADFGAGRMMNRRAVYETLGYPLGMLSEDSTEANARVAIRQYWDRIWRLHIRAGRKVTADALPFWSSPERYRAGFVDVRQRDWDAEYKRAKTEALRGRDTGEEIVDVEDDEDE